MHKHHVVVDDPTGQYYEGSLVEPVRAEQLRTKGTALLPVDPNLFLSSGVGGYFRRGWGSGWPFVGAHPMMHAPLLLLCDERHTWLHWCARLVRSDAGPIQPGQLRIAADPGQHTAGRIAKLRIEGLPIDVQKLGPVDPARGGWVVGGTAALTIGAEGHYGFSLWGYAPGMSVVWVAASVVAPK